MLECNEMFLNFPGWHHRLNSKAGMGGLSFYRLVPLLRREATLMELALRSGDLQRDRRGTTRRLEVRLGVWDGLRFVIVALPGLFSYLF